MGLPSTVEVSRRADWLVWSQGSAVLLMTRGDGDGDGDGRATGGLGAQKFGLSFLGWIPSHPIWMPADILHWTTVLNHVCYCYCTSSKKSV